MEFTLAEVRYTPASGAEWIAAAAAGRLLLVEGELSEERRDALWAALLSHGGVQVVLDELTRGGISSTPSFGLVSWAGEIGAGSSLAVIVRGDVDVIVRTAAVELSLDGRGVSTWTEKTIPDAVAVQVSGGTRSPGGSPDSGFRLGSGMVCTSQAWVGELHGDAPAPVDADASSDGPEALAPSSSKASSPTEETPPPVEGAPQPVKDRSAPSETTRVEFTRPEAGVDEHVGGDPEESSGYDHLFGETIVRTVEDAAIREAVEGESLDDGVATKASEPLEGDHDGKTQLGLDRETRRAARRARAKADSGVPVSAPAMFIELSTGAREELSQPIVIGRAPSVSKVSGASLPRLVTIAGSDQDISRNHVQVAVEGGTVVVTDLHSRNGTMVVLPNRAPQQLRAGDPTAVIVGTVVDLGGGVSFTVREG